MNSQYYLEELKCLRESVREKRRGKLSLGVLPLQDNAPAHTAKLSVETAAVCGFKLLPHPPYLPELAPTDCFLFPKMMGDLRGRKFSNDNAVMEAVEELQIPQFFTDSLVRLVHRWKKCAAVGRDYIKK